MFGRLSFYRHDSPGNTVNLIWWVGRVLAEEMMMFGERRGTEAVVGAVVTTTAAMVAADTEDCSEGVWEDFKLWKELGNVNDVYDDEIYLHWILSIVIVITRSDDNAIV